MMKTSDRVGIRAILICLSAGLMYLVSPAALSATNLTHHNVRLGQPDHGKFIFGVRPGVVHYTFRRPLPGGGYEYIFNLDGVQNIEPVTPKTFNPLTAAPNRLVEYGFPTRPSGGPQLDTWKYDMQHWRWTAGSPTILITKLVASTEYGTSPVWSGWATGSTKNKAAQWVSAEGDFHQPAYHKSACSTTYEVSWSGIGGVNTPSLLQDGTEIDNGSTYFAWYEYLAKGQKSIKITELPKVKVHAGDHIHTYVTYERSNDLADYYVADDTDSTSQPMEVKLSSAYYDGSTTEFIDERPTAEPSGVPVDLADYGTNSWFSTEAQATNGSWQDLGKVNNIYIEMLDNAGDVMSSPTSGSLPSSTSFTDQWMTCD